MKKLSFIILMILFLLPCLLLSCKEAVDGIGTDPELNLEEYTFSEEGGVLEVYSQRNAGIQFHLSEPVPVVEIEEGIDGGWFKVTYVIGAAYKYGTRIRIEVEANDTGKERIVPISISSYNYGCYVMYKQK